MNIDWATLATIAVVAAAAALSVVLLVAFAVVALSGPRELQVEGPNDHAPRVSPAVGRIVAGLCLLAAGLIVCFGLYLIIA